MTFKSRYIKNDVSSNNSNKSPEEDMDFMVWKAELDSELLSFWKSLNENYRD